MASIYDFGGGPPSSAISESPKRSKKREQLTVSEKRNGQRKLFAMVERAFETLENAMDQADFPTAVKAAQIILDRTGFGPKSTMDINTTHVDLSELSRDELAARAMQLAARIQQAQVVIDVTPTVN